MLDRQSGPDALTRRILADPAFVELVKERRRFDWTMSAVMLVVYLAFVFLAAFGKAFMSATIGDSSISWGIALGLVTIVFAFALTGVYVTRANGRFDELNAKIADNRS